MIVTPRYLILSRTVPSRVYGAGIAQSVEVLYFTIELHTSSVRVRVQPGTKYLYEKNLSECMWFGCRLPVAVVSQAYPGNGEICPGFPPPQAALRIKFSNVGDAVYIDRSVSFKHPN